MRLDEAGDKIIEISVMMFALSVQSIALFDQSVSTASALER